MKRFCEYQIKCCEDTESTFSCTAHLHESRCFQCSYKSFKDTKLRKYPCVDAKKVEK